MNPQLTTYDLQPNRGFSLIEMLMVMGIFAFLSGMIFVNYGKFNTKASLDNLTHQVALVIRQAQVYGISVSQGDQFKGYGVYFSTATPEDKVKFILFKDYNPQDKKYNPRTNPCGGDANDECLGKISIQSGDVVNKIIANGETSAPGIELREANIVFTRPSPDAQMTGLRGDNGANIDNIADLEVYLLSPRGPENKVVVWSTGQIAVE